MNCVVKKMFKVLRLVGTSLVLCGVLFNVQPCYAAGGASKVVSAVVKGVMNAFKAKPPKRVWKSVEGSQTWKAHPIAIRNAIKQVNEARQSDDSGDLESNMDAGDEGVRKKRIENLFRQCLKGEKSADVVGWNESSTVRQGRTVECKNDSGDGKGAGFVVTVIILVLIVLGFPCLILWLIIASCSDDDGEPQTKQRKEGNNDDKGS